MKNVLLPINIFNKIALIIRSVYSESSNYTLSEITSKIISFNPSLMIYRDYYISIYKAYIASGIFSSLYKFDDNDQVINFPSYGAFLDSHISSVSYDNCLYIGAHAFEKCSTLEDAHFSRCQVVDSFAFANCSNLYSCYFPECVTIKTKVFKDCANLLEVSFPKCQEIGNYAFFGCNYIEHIYLPNIKIIPYKAFQQCHYLTTMSITDCRFVDDYAFDYCDMLQDAILPNCSILGKYAFRSCTFSSISLPNCKFIDDGTFYNCSSLESITLNNCMAIGDLAFYNCVNLSKIRLMGSNPITLLGNNAFKGTMFDIRNDNISNAKIYVPYDLYSYYREKWASCINVGTIAVIA